MAKRTRTISEVTRDIEEQLDVAKNDDAIDVGAVVETIASPPVIAADAVEVVDEHARSIEETAEQASGETPKAKRAYTRRKRVTSIQEKRQSEEIAERLKMEALESMCKNAARETWVTAFALWARATGVQGRLLSDGEADKLGEAWAPIIAMHSDKMMAFLPYMSALSVTVNIGMAKLAEGRADPEPEGAE